MMTRNLRAWLMSMSLIVMGGGAVSLAADLVQNGAFEGPAGADGLPPGWVVYGEKSAVSYDAAAKCVCINAHPGEVSLRQGNLALDPGKQYRLTCQVKTEGFDGKKGGGVTVVDNGWSWTCDELRPEAATADWTKLETVFTPKLSSNGKYQVVYIAT